MQGNGFSQFMKNGVTPTEASHLTGGLVHPLEDIKTGLRQLPGTAKENARLAALKAKAEAYKMFTAVKPLTYVFSKHGKGFLITPPGILQENEERKKLNEQPFTSLEAGNVRHNR